MESGRAGPEDLDGLIGLEHIPAPQATTDGKQGKKHGQGATELF